MDAADQPAAGARPDLGTPARNELRDRLLRAGAFQIAEAYEGAVAVLNQPALPSRHHLLAHLVRDIAEGLPEVLTGKSKELRRSNTKLLLDKLAVEWRKEVPPPALFAASDDSEPPPLTQPVPVALVAKVDELLTEHKRGELNRHGKYARLMEALRPGSEALRPTLEPIVREWVKLVEWFQAQTHLRRAASAAPTDEELTRRFENFEYGLRGLLDGHFEVVREIDAILDGPGSVEEKLARVKPFLAGAEQLRRFFERLDDPAWLPVLAAAELMMPPPPIVDEERNTIAHWSWPAAPYLIKMAEVPAAQAGVVDFAARIETQNYRVQNDLAEIALRLPTALAARMARPLGKALKTGQGRMSPPTKLFELTAKLARAGEKKAGEALLKGLVAVIPDPRCDREFAWPEPRTRVDHHTLAELAGQHLSGIVAGLGLDALGILCSALARAVTLSSRDGRDNDIEDYSYIWYPAIEQAHDRDARGVLVTLVRQAAECLVSSDVSLVPAVLDRLEQRRRLIFRRIALHVLLRVPEPPAALVSARVLDRTLFDHLTTCREYRMLLERGFALLSAEQQGQWLTWIDAPPAAEEVRAHLEGWSSDTTTDADVLAWQRRWRWQRLGPVGQVLPSDWKARFDALVQEFGPPVQSDAVRNRSWGGALSFESPWTRDALSKLTCEALAQRLQEWQPSADQPFVTRRRLGEDVQALVAETPERYASRADLFSALHPTYVNAFFTGLRLAVEAARAFPWAPALDLAAWATAQPVERSEDPGLTEDKGWGFTRWAVLRLLEVTLQREPSPLTLDQRPMAWRLIERLREDPDKVRRSDALERACDYAQWARIAAGRDRFGNGSLDDLPEVCQIFDGVWSSPRPATVREYETLGRMVPWLVFLDEAWLRSRLPQIFPTASEHGELWNAAWRAYLRFPELKDRVFGVMRSSYEFAIARLGDYGDDEPALEPARMLAEHLAVFYGRGTLEAQDAVGLLTSFFDAANARLRRHFHWYVGESMRESAASDIPADVPVRFRALWQQRRERMGDAPTVRDELRAFGMWFACRFFDEAWRLEQLEFVLRTVDEIDHDHLVVETLADIAARRPAEAVRCFWLLVGKLKDAGSVYGWLDPAKTILGVGLRSDDKAVRDDALAAFHRLGDLGFRAREIVPISDDLDDPAAIAYFTWDHPMTVAEVRRRLTEGSEPERHRMLGQILREAKPPDVWKFTTPEQVRDLWPLVEKHLGRRRGLWEFLFEQWKEQGLLAAS